MENTWFYWALASAFFAALTAIFAKAGLQGIDSDFATFIRTLVIIAALAAFLSYAGKWQGVGDFSAKNWTFSDSVGLGDGRIMAGLFQSLADGRSVESGTGGLSSAIVLVALFAVIFLKERPSSQEWLGIALIAGGVLTLALSVSGQKLLG